MVGDKAPTPCTRWAVSDEGWCWQHYASEKERIIKADRIAIARAKLTAQIDQYISWKGTHPSVWDRPRAERKGPHRIG